MMIPRFGAQQPMAIRFQSSRPHGGRGGADKKQPTSEAASGDKKNNVLERLDVDELLGMVREARVQHAEKRHKGLKKLAGGLMIGSLGLGGVFGMLASASDADADVTAKGETLMQKAWDVNPVDQKLAEQNTDIILNEYEGDTPSDSQRIATMNQMLDVLEQRERADLQSWLDELGVEASHTTFIDRIEKLKALMSGLPGGPSAKTTTISDERFEEIAKRLNEDNSIENQRAVFNEMMDRDLVNRFSTQTELLEAKEAGNFIFDEVEANQAELDKFLVPGLLAGGGSIGLAMFAALMAMEAGGQKRQAKKLRKSANIA